MSEQRPTVLITGGTRGIGRAVADRLADDWHLLIGGRDADAVQKTCAQLPSAAPFVADLADEEATAAAAAQIESLDAVVHSAGLLGNADVDSFTRADWRKTFEVNVFAVADLTRLLLPRLRDSRGTVVVVNSGSGLRAHGPGGIYSASKHAVGAFTGALRDEVRDDGIRVSSVHPGRVDTDMQHELVEYEGKDYDAGAYLRPESVAEAVHLALSATDDACVDMIAVRPSGRRR